MAVLKYGYWCQVPRVRWDRKLSAPGQFSRAEKILFCLIIFLFNFRMLYFQRNFDPVIRQDSIAFNSWIEHAPII
jgi:hypothetical protein